MELGFCMTCNYENDFRLLRDDIINIKSELNDLIELNHLDLDSVELNNEYYEIFNNIVLENSHLDAPCGGCYKVDGGELTLLQDDIKGMLSKIIIYVFRGDCCNSIKANVANKLIYLFQSHCSAIHNLIGYEFC